MKEVLNAIRTIKDYCSNTDCNKCILEKVLLCKNQSPNNWDNEELLKAEKDFYSLKNVGEMRAYIKPYPDTEEVVIADGRELSRIVYSDLFAEIGTTFGAGNGIDTFNIPNWVDETCQQAYYIKII